MNHINSADLLTSAAMVAAAPAPRSTGSSATRATTVDAPADGGATQATAGQQPDKAALRQAVSQLEQRVSSPNLQFAIDSDSGRTVVRITDAETKELIRQIPPQEVIRLSQELERMQGLLLNKQA